MSAMSYDIHHRLRGACLSCGECPSFISLSGQIFWDYCGCPPARHTKLKDDNMITKDHKSENPTSEEVAATLNKFKGLRGQISNQSFVHPRVTHDIRSYFHPQVNQRKMPRRVDLLLDMPEVKLGWKDQAKHGWNDQDKSHNLYLKSTDQTTVLRTPVAQSTDAIRTITSYERGLHVFELTWSSKHRGTHAVVGVATAEAPIHSNGYMSLVGSNANSWGWDLGRSKAYHDGGNNKNGSTYPAFLAPTAAFNVPDKFLMILDMDEGTLAFAVDDQYLGVAHTGLKGKKVFPMVSTVWGQCEINIKYIGGMDSQPMPLMDLCSQAVRRIMGTKLDEKSLLKLKLPKILVKYLDWKDKDMVQHFKDKNMISQV